MDDHLKTQYENYFALFRTEGWKQFIEDMSIVYEGYQIEDIKDDLGLAKVQGERKILRNVLVFEDAIRTTYDTLMEESSDTAL